MGVEEARAEYLVNLVGRYAPVDSRILEVGCRSGDNIATLWDAGFRNLTGLESRDAKAQLFEERHPAAAKGAVVRTGPIEDSVGRTGDREYHLVFTVGFLFDREGDHSWLFPELARIAGGYLLSIEDERTVSLKRAYEGQGLEEVEFADISAMEPLASVFTVRVFRKGT